MPDDLADTIADIAASPQTVTAGDRTVSEHRIPDLIEADKYLAGKRAATGTSPTGGPRSPWASLRPAKVIPPGAV